MRKFVIVILILALVAGGYLWFRSRSNEEPTIEGPAVSVRFLDDEAGSAVLVRTPEGKVVVIDPTGRRITALADMLSDERTRSICVVVNQPSYDSANAIAKLQRSVKVERVIAVQQPGKPDKWDPMLARARCKTVTTSPLAPGASARLSPSVRLNALDCSSGAKHQNGSCVIRLDYGGKSVLYVAELDQTGEAALISSGANLQSSVLAVGKRASKDNPSIELLAKVRPEICVLCFNRPKTSLISRLRQENSGATLFRTDKDGIIEIVTDGRSVQSLTGGGP